MKILFLKCFCLYPAVKLHNSPLMSNTTQELGTLKSVGIATAEVLPAPGGATIKVESGEL